MNNDKLVRSQRISAARELATFKISIDHFLLSILEGDLLATALLTQIRYYSNLSRSRSGGKTSKFYKFISPCTHPFYNENDSWEEELFCSKRSILYKLKELKILKLINVETDKTKGNLTFYSSNEKRIENLLDEYFENNIDLYESKILKKLKLKST